MHAQYAMRYVDVAIGTGKLAEAGKVFSVHYTGWLLDGTKFDSLAREEASVVRAREAQSDSRLGRGLRRDARRREAAAVSFLISSRMARKGRGKIPPKAELIFDVELMDVKDPPPAEPAK